MATFLVVVIKMVSRLLDQEWEMAWIGAAGRCHMVRQLYDDIKRRGNNVSIMAKRWAERGNGLSRD